MTDIADGSRTGGAQGESGMRAAFETLTEKQHEVLRLVAENRTSKEIAWELGISESAVNQRIEGVRARTSGASRAELARGYRQYRQDLGVQAEADCKPVPDKKFQVHAAPATGQTVSRNGPAESGAAATPERDQFALADAVTFTLVPPWQGERADRIVPEVLDGAHAGLSRTAAMIAIAVGILVVAIVGLGVVQALNDIY